MKHLKKLTLLHSNDMHGDFMAKEVDDRLIGGVSMLSGYVGKVRREERNVVYSISGDMFRGSLIDSEYKGLSTVEIMNILAPDVVTLGNHEVDYGIAHLLFIVHQQRVVQRSYEYGVRKACTRYYRHCHSRHLAENE